MIQKDLGIIIKTYAIVGILCLTDDEWNIFTDLYRFPKNIITVCIFFIMNNYDKSPTRYVIVTKIVYKQILVFQ
jgi:hypothetical protein